MTPQEPSTTTLPANGPAAGADSSIPASTAAQAAALYGKARPRVIIALPAYNEEESLGLLLDGIGKTMIELGLDYLVIVVDDGSTDETARVASQASFRLPVKLVEHNENSGLAAALRTGFKEAVAESQTGDIIVTMDADNTQPPGLMPRMLGLLCEGCDVVIASRFQPGAKVLGVPWNRVLFSQAARWLFTLVLPIRGVRDYTCGYRAYRAGVLHDALNKHGDAFVSEQGFSCMVDVLLKLRGEGLVIGEAPLILRYDQKGGASKMPVARTIWQTLSLLARRRVAR